MVEEGAFLTGVGVLALLAYLVESSETGVSSALAIATGSGLTRAAALRGVVEERVDGLVGVVTSLAAEAEEPRAATLALTLALRRAGAAFSSTALSPVAAAAETSSVEEATKEESSSKEEEEGANLSFKIISS